MSNNFTTTQTAWCPGCGNFSILESLKDALNNLGLKPYRVLVVGGIGQAAKTPQYINSNGFCGLHGRALPPAAAAKIVNKDLTVIVSTGDGDSYGEGGNHFMHNIRRNVDITHFVHNNQIYGLTKGQASPTTDMGDFGSINIPMNPLSLALSLGAGFVARGFSGDTKHLTYIMEEAIKFKGYSLVDILQPCISFNKINTFKWYKDRVYKLDVTYDSTNRINAIEKAMEWGEKIPTGILFKEEKSDYHEKISFLRDEKPLVDQEIDNKILETFMLDFV